MLHHLPIDSSVDVFSYGQRRRVFLVSLEDDELFTLTFSNLLQEFYHGVAEKEVVREDTRERERITIERGMKPGEKSACGWTAHA